MVPAGPRRRAVIAASGAILAGCTSRSAPAARVLRFFTSHQAAVVQDATARIAPGPHDDPAEAGHPGAREADVAGYIDTMLGALQEDNPPIFAGGPWSNRHTSGPDLMDRFVPLDPVARIAWRKRLAGWQEIGFPGDSQPRGYTSDEVERSDGHDPVTGTGIVGDVLKLLGAI